LLPWVRALRGRHAAVERRKFAAEDEARADLSIDTGVADNDGGTVCGDRGRAELGAQRAGLGPRSVCVTRPDGVIQDGQVAVARGGHEDHRESSAVVAVMLLM